MKELEAIRGRHTELVSVYVPAGYNLNEISNQLYTEKSTAMNIKSKTTRKNVLDSLEKIIQHLRIFKQTPANGLIVFCGNVSEIEGKEDLKIWSFEPPEKMNTKVYWCDQVFVLDPLREIVSEKEVYGLIVLDSSEADIGLLYGKKISPMKHIDSLVAGKSIKGGMCLSPDTLVHLADGRVISIRELKDEDNPILSTDLINYKSKYCFHNDIIPRNTRDALEILTTAPSMRITSTPEHRFFTTGDNGVEIKYAEDLKPNDNLLAIKNIRFTGRVPSFDSRFLSHDRKDRLELYQFLGYLLGDGTKDVNRIIIYDKDEDLIKTYQKIANKLFKVYSKRKFRKSRGSNEVRIYSKELMGTIDYTFEGILISRKRKIPTIIQKLPNEELSRFISGLFDAEGYVDLAGKTIGITMASPDVIRVLQVLLLRFGIISSYAEELYKGKFMKYRVRITGTDSMRQFQNVIGFLSKDKSNDLKKVLKIRKDVSFSNQVPVNGKFILKLARELRMNTESFPKVQDFFYNKKRQSFPVFEKQIIKYFLERQHEIMDSNSRQIKKFRENLRFYQHEIAEQMNVSTTTICGLENKKHRNVELQKKVELFLENEKDRLVDKSKEIIDLLERIAKGDLIITKVREVRKSNTIGTFYDISIPTTQNFIANGLIVHNSQRRYDRIREEALNEFFKEIANISSDIFVKQKELKGIIIGGPGPIKDQFVKGEFLNYQLIPKIIGVKDIGYTGEHGFEELVQRSEDLLKEAAVMKERQLLQKFLAELQKGGSVVYGYTQTIETLNMGVMETLLVSEGFDWVRVKLKCDNTHETEKDLPGSEIERQVCEVCGQSLKVEDKDYLGELLAEKAQNFGTKVEIISTDTQEGMQFKQLGGIGGFLRYRLR